MTYDEDWRERGGHRASLPLVLPHPSGNLDHMRYGSSCVRHDLVRDSREPSRVKSNRTHITH